MVLDTIVRFRSPQFPSHNSNVEGPNFENGVYGKRLAEYFCGRLPSYGFQVADCFAEDWGWMVELKHDRKFPFFVGCGHAEGQDDNYLCFIEPSKPVIRRWFKKMDVRDDILALKNALAKILENDPQIHSIEWSE